MVVCAGANHTDSRILRAIKLKMPICNFWFDIRLRSEHGQIRCL